MGPFVGFSQVRDSMGNSEPYVCQNSVFGLGFVAAELPAQKELVMVPITWSIYVLILQGVDVVAPVLGRIHVDSTKLGDRHLRIVVVFGGIVYEGQ
ncbi:hypothetical protein VNO78_25386 [Psophocarpus tetragonolobus]|uniref:Uncharacterized protein n=1 Tax=Psophocarpus tetragonolobus TaxID=3891 RepID=A0AAN9XFC9_PSOTE